MADPAWDYSDYITYERGDSTRLTRLRLHIQEVSDFISTGSVTLEGQSVSKGDLQRYLADLRDEEKELSAIHDSTRATWVRGRPKA